MWFDVEGLAPLKSPCMQLVEEVTDGTVPPCLDSDVSKVD